MAKLSSIETNNRRAKIIARDASKRQALKDIIHNPKTTIDEKFHATLKLASLPRNGSSTRFRNRCLLTGRSRGFHRKFQISRIMLRKMASEGLIPGMTKSSW